jgi:hypothetical protein
MTTQKRALHYQTLAAFWVILTEVDSATHTAQQRKRQQHKGHEEGKFSF